jgi:hypothetical protein
LWIEIKRKVRLIIEVDPENDPVRPLGVFQSVFLADVYVPSFEHSPGGDYKIEDCVVIYATTVELKPGSQKSQQLRNIEQAVRAKTKLTDFGVRQIYLCHDSDEKKLVERCQRLIEEVLIVSIQPDAAARVAELRMQPELQQMIQHTREVVPQLKHIRVVLDPPYDTGDDPYLTIEATRGGTYNGDDPTQREWGAWFVNQFSPDVCRHFNLQVLYGTTDAG